LKKKNEIISECDAAALRLRAAASRRRASTLLSTCSPRRAHARAYGGRDWHGWRRRGVWRRVQRFDLFQRGGFAGFVQADQEEAQLRLGAREGRARGA
jgi:hypothetical protein